MRLGLAVGRVTSSNTSKPPEKPAEIVVIVVAAPEDDFTGHPDFEPRQRFENQNMTPDPRMP